MAFLFTVLKTIQCVSPPRTTMPWVKTWTRGGAPSGAVTELPYSLAVPFLSMVTRRSCLLCDWVQLMTGSASPSSVLRWPTVRIWIWPSSCWKVGPSIAAEPQTHKSKLHQNTMRRLLDNHYLLLPDSERPNESQLSKTQAVVTIV